MSGPRRPRGSRGGWVTGRVQQALLHGQTPTAALPLGVRSTIDRERVWPAKLRHPIQDVAREARLDLSAVVTAGSKAVPDDPLVPEERVLDARLPMIARRVLPSSAAECLHPPNGSIPGARPRSPARDTGRPVGRDNDALAVLGVTNLLERIAPAGACWRPGGGQGDDGATDHVSLARCFSPVELQTVVGPGGARPCL